MPKQPLRNMDLAALSVALDRAEEDGLTTEVPAPNKQPADCVYLKYVGDKQAELFASRLPHAVVKVLMPSDEGYDTRSRKVNVYSKKAILHVLGFLLTPEEIDRCTRPLNTVRRTGWSVV
jgi:hypothetical protein